MRSTFSKSGQSSAKILAMPAKQSCEKLESGISQNEPSVKTFGNWKPQTGSSLKPSPNPMETWRMMQARSILGSNASPQDIQNLMKTTNLETREPLNATTPAPSRFARALKALRLAMGSVLLGMGFSA